MTATKWDPEGESDLIPGPPSWLIISNESQNRLHSDTIMISWLTSDFPSAELQVVKAVIPVDLRVAYSQKSFLGEPAWRVHSRAGPALSAKLYRRRRRNQLFRKDIILNLNFKNNWYRGLEVTARVPERVLALRECREGGGPRAAAKTFNLFEIKALTKIEVKL